MTQSNSIMITATGYCCDESPKCGCYIPVSGGDACKHRPYGKDCFCEEAIRDAEIRWAKQILGIDVPVVAKRYRGIPQDAKIISCLLTLIAAEDQLIEVLELRPNESIRRHLDSVRSEVADYAVEILEPYGRRYEHLGDEVLEIAERIIEAQHSVTMPHLDGKQ